MTMPNLPIPNAIALQHSDTLLQKIREEIAANQGFITFAHYMTLALYTPGLGYYSAGSHKLGKTGDYITAPLISPLFARCIARQCETVAHVLGAYDILELGAGTGDMACDILLALEQTNALPERYRILDVSADLRERQEATLTTRCPHLLSKVQWEDHLPQQMNGIILANEVLDAMPVHCFQLSEESINERGVTWKDNQLQWALKPCPDLAQRVGKLQLPPGYESEINLLLPSWLASLAHSLEKGVIVFFDYGYGEREYYHPDRAQGTLKCFYQHHHHDNPLLWPGLQDITAHVNFTQVAESAIESGLTLIGYTTQASFLLASGLLTLSESLPLTEAERYQQNQAIKTLTLPSQMGEVVKVMALGKNWEESLVGFDLFDRRGDL